MYLGYLVPVLAILLNNIEKLESEGLKYYDSLAKYIKFSIKKGDKFFIEFELNHCINQFLLYIN